MIRKIRSQNKVYSLNLSQIGYVMRGKKCLTQAHFDFKLSDCIFKLKMNVHN